MPVYPFNTTPDEIVHFLGRGELSLRIAVGQVLALPEGRRMHATLFRGTGKIPSTLHIEDIELLESFPTFMASAEVA